MNWKEKSGIFSLVFVLGLFFHLSHINEFPLYTHAWAQSDRYAIALGFLDNGFDLFHPQTYVMNTQFPGEFQIPGKTSITAVDFPIHEYIIAGFMNVFGTRDPWIFRLYELLFGIIGLLYLFKLSRLIGNSYNAAVFTTVFAALSPVWMYYLDGFLPGIPALACSIIGLYFYFYHRKQEVARSFYTAIFFLTLAAACRTTFLIPLLAVAGMEVLRMLVQKKINVKHLLGIAAGFGFLAAYLLLNAHLRKTYGSLFLNVLKPAESIEEAISIFKDVYHSWTFHYLNAIQYALLILLLPVALYQIKQKTAFTDHTVKLLFLFFGINLLGCVCFLVAMLQQFRAHDYYFIDTFYLPVVLLFVLLIRLLQPLFKKHPAATGVWTGVVLVIGMTALTYQTQKEKRVTGHWDKSASMVWDYQGMDLKLDSIGISRSSKLLVLDTQAPNIPFIRMQRKGFVVVTTSTENLQAAMNWPYDYLIIQDNWFMSDIYSNYPEIIQQIDRIADLGPVSIYKRAGRKHDRSLFDFLGLNLKTPVLHVRQDFEQQPDARWQHNDSTIQPVFEGRFSGFTAPDKEYGPTFKTAPTALFEKQENMLIVDMDVLHPELIPESRLVVSLEENGVSNYYKDISLEALKRDTADWKRVRSVFSLPRSGPKTTLSVFIWNRGQDKIYLDNLDISLYQ